MCVSIYACVSHLTPQCSRGRMGRGGRLIFDRMARAVANAAHVVLGSAAASLLQSAPPLPSVPSVPSAPDALEHAPLTAHRRAFPADRLKLQRLYDASDSEGECEPCSTLNSLSLSLSPSP